MAVMPIRPLPACTDSHYVRGNDKKIGNAWGQPAARTMRAKGRRTMAYDACLDRVSHDVAFPNQPSQQKRSSWRRWLDAVLAAQQRRADRELARYIATRGGITDSTEREIEHRFLFQSVDAWR